MDWKTHDYELVRRARIGNLRVLEDLDPVHFPQRAPTIEVACADWLPRHEMVTHLATMRGLERDEDPQVHLLSWHAGPVRLHYRSTTNKKGQHLTFTDELVEAVELTGIRDVNLHGHWPCKKCFKHGLGVEDVWCSIMTILPMLQRVLREVKIRTLFHVDYQENEPHGMKNYRLHPERCVGMVSQIA
ncbi:MAG: hypothetical protein AAB652_00685 [Patescibacteria group bacterium]